MENAPTTQQALATELAEILTYIQRHFIVNLTREVTKQKISIPQFALLGHLSSRKEPANMTQLAQFMNHTTPATTGLIDRLAEGKLVERVPSTQDRRQVMVKITPKGLQVVQSLKDEMTQHINKILEKLTPDDRQAWIRIYRTMSEYCSTCSTVKQA